MNNIEVDSIIFNFEFLNKQVKKLGYEIKNLWTNFIFAMFMLFCVFMTISAGLFVFLLNYPTIGCLVVLICVDVFVFVSSIIFLLIGINARKKRDQSSEFKELQKKQLAERKTYVERMLYSFMDAPFGFDSVNIGEEQLPNKRESFKKSPFALEKVEYLTNKFLAELQFLSKKEKSVVDISIIVVVITAGLDMVKEIVSLWLQYTPENINNEIFKNLGTTAGSVIAFVFICIIVYLISEWTSTTKITYRTQMRNIEYTLNVLSEIKKGILNNAGFEEKNINRIDKPEESNEIDESNTPDTSDSSESDDSDDEKE